MKKKKFALLLTLLMVLSSCNLAVFASTGYVGAVSSDNLVSMTLAEEIDVKVDFGYEVDLENIQWTFGEKSFDQWKKYDVDAGSYTGEPFVTLTSETQADREVVLAKVFFDLPYSNTDLSPRSIRTEFPDLLGTYSLTATDVSTGESFSVQIKYNAYDSYTPYDEIYPELSKIMANANEDMYVEYYSPGQSYEGRDFHMMIIAQDEESVDKYLNDLLPMALESPEKVQAMIESGELTDYQLPIFINNIHPDESPGIDGQIDAMKLITTQEEIIYDTVDEDGQTVEVTLNVKEALEDAILVFDLTENPDGRYYNTRQNSYGFDVNRDNIYQTQIESQIITAEIAKWTPVILDDLHGFVNGFLIEPCTPPHDPNYEYDLMADNMVDHANAIGNAAVSNTIYESYFIPLLDWGVGWDDATAAYTATYAMHHGTAGHTVEIPDNNQDSTDACKYVILESLRYLDDNKDKLYLAQLEYFQRGTEGIDDPATDAWFTSAEGEMIGRPREDGQSFFPDYYIIPFSEELQKDEVAAYVVLDQMISNGIQVSQLNADAVIEGTTYPEGTYVVDMEQAKRGLANTMLYTGADFSDYSEMYAEIVVNMPALRGFDCYAIYQDSALSTKLDEVEEITVPATEFLGDNTDTAYSYIIDNNTNDAVLAVNELLSQDFQVELITSEGEFNGDFKVSKDAIASVSDDYTLDVYAYTNYYETTELSEMSVYVPGDEQVEFILEMLGFRIVKDIDAADVIVDDSGYASLEEINQKPYIGIGYDSMALVEELALLDGFEPGITNGSHEGLLYATYSADNMITSGYEDDMYLYTAGGSWIAKVPTSATALYSTTSDAMIAGWWPGNEAANNQVMAIDCADEDITLFANTITNKAHPQGYFRLLSNAIYTSDF